MTNHNERKLFERCLELPKSERAAWLTVQCGEDEPLRERLLRLLSAHEEASAHPTGIVTGEFDHFANERIGPYKLLEPLGEGGSGIVYLAEQQQPINRKVALKLIKLGMDTKDVVARFDAERQALALMNHPNVAKVFDAGSTDIGRPYFVMEYVPGIPLTDYCDQHKMPIRDRLQLFARVCDGVQHAHHKGIIHRDLKPSNVLAAIEDGQVVPKIIDFGIAKATARPLTPQTLHTHVGMVIGTPAYMSPEQADLTHQNVDTRTDVYSLGIILYELLTGSLPFPIEEFAGLGLDEMRKKIREVLPDRPSTRVQRMGNLASKAALSRETEPLKLVRQLRGDLDWIVTKALEKDRTRRYDSPLLLASDIRRHLQDEPVLARSPSSLYRMRKFLVRNRVGVTIAAVLLGVLLSFSVLMTVQAARIARERDRANHEAAVAEQVKEFLTGLFHSSDPTEARGAELTARQILDRGLREIAYVEEPSIRAEMLSTLGRVYGELGEYQKRLELSEEAVSVWRQLRGDEDPKVFGAWADLAGAHQAMGNYAAAESLYAISIAGWMQAGLEMESRAIAARIDAANLQRQRGNFRKAEGQFRALIQILQAEGRTHARQIFRIQRQLAFLYNAEGKYEEAGEYYELALRGTSDLLGDDHPETVIAMSGLSNVYGRQGRLEEAEALLLKAMEVNRATFGENHPAIMTSLEALGILLYRQERYEESIDAMKEVLELRRKLLGDEHRSTLVSMSNIAGVMGTQGRYDEARPLLEEALDIQSRTLGERHLETLNSHINLAMLEVRVDNYDLALQHLQQAVGNGYAHSFLLQDDVGEVLRPLESRPEFVALMDTVRSRLGSN